MFTLSKYLEKSSSQDWDFSGYCQKWVIIFDCNRDIPSHSSWSCFVLNVYDSPTLTFNNNNNNDDDEDDDDNKNSNNSSNVCCWQL